DRKGWWVWLAAGTGAGVLVALSVPPFGWWPLAWVGFGVIACLLPGLAVWPRVLLGAGLGAGQYSIGLFWVHEFSVPGCVVLILWSSLYIAAALALVPTSRRRSIVLALPAMLVLAEWLRDRYPLGGLPLGEASLGQAAGPLAPSLRLGGSLLLTGETVLAGLALAAMVHLVRTWRQARSPWSAGAAAWGTARPARGSVSTAGGAVRRAWIAVVTVSAAAVAVPVVGLLSPSGAGGQVAPTRVALVQGGGPRGTRAINTDPGVVFGRHLSESANLHAPLDLVVWPEGVLQSGDVKYTDTVEASEISNLASALNATVLVGVEQNVGATHFINAVVAWGPDGRVVGSYQKNHLVPFGEYIPLRSVLKHFFNLAAVPLDAVPGHSPGFIATPAGPLGIMISYEVFFDTRARGAVRAGGEVLVVPTNTASYSSSQVPAQEVAAAQLRAWETGRWVLQVTPTGFTAVISPTGQVIKHSALGQPEIITATVPMETGRTWYVDLGDLPTALAALVMVVLAWALAGTGDAGVRHRDRWSRREEPKQKGR
ncbi:MAG TPA: apolipoprotein N-acyltransferase, partial [Acidimicrobiales bacterium]|nr:apolipoprotein N-acyltransferase [Acidimicrobiales bacterium]